jgi:hypothetical protein
MLQLSLLLDPSQTEQGLHQTSVVQHLLSGGSDLCLSLVPGNGHLHSDLSAHGVASCTHAAGFAHTPHPLPAQIVTYSQVHTPAALSFL